MCQTQGQGLNTSAPWGYLSVTLYLLFFHVGSIGLSLQPSCPPCLIVQPTAFRVPQVSRQPVWSCRHSCWPLLQQFTRDLLGSWPVLLERETCRPWGQKLVSLC